MLNKEVCRSCKRRKWGREEAFVKYFNFFWDDGQVFCYAVGGYVKYEGTDVPENCPYLTEHVVSGDAEGGQDVE